MDHNYVFQGLSVKVHNGFLGLLKFQIYFGYA